jgi:hypothetical protein
MIAEITKLTEAGAVSWVGVGDFHLARLEDRIAIVFWDFEEQAFALVVLTEDLTHVSYRAECPTDLVMSVVSASFAPLKKVRS